jgi:hypothetical protein
VTDIFCMHIITNRGYINQIAVVRKTGFKRKTGDNRIPQVADSSWRGTLADLSIYVSTTLYWT